MRVTYRDRSLGNFRPISTAKIVNFGALCKWWGLLDVAAVFEGLAEPREKANDYYDKFHGVVVSGVRMLFRDKISN